MHTSAFNFQTLFPELIIDALFNVGIRVDSGLTALNSYENRVYQFMDEERRRFVVKFYRPERWTEAQIQEEHDFALELAEDEVPVVAPLAWEGETLHCFQGFHFAVFPSMGARQYEMDSDEQLEWVARFLGRLHQTGRKRIFVARPTLGLREYIEDPYRLLEQTALIPETQREGFLQVTRQLVDSIKSYWPEEMVVLRLHGDCHPGNILWRDGPLFVDLDDARNGPAVQDLWMLLHGERHEQRIQLDMLLEAYSEFMTFQEKELALIEPLRAMRMVHYLAWVIRRWDDPAFPKNFPWIKEDDFWREQRSIFAEQVKRLQEPPLELLSMY